jgi:glutamine synthetase
MEDHAFLTESGVFSEAFVKGFCEFKRKEARNLATRPHPYEVEMYLDC